MIEKYFEDGTELISVKDNGTTLSFTCSNPNWNKEETISLSDIGIARVFGIDMKQYTREEFLQEVAEMFPAKIGRYKIPDWNFPIPLEWKDNIISYLESAKQNKIFNAIDVSTLREQNPALYRYALLQAIIKTYHKYSPESKAIPSDLLAAQNDPSILFTEEVYFTK